MWPMQAYSIEYSYDVLIDHNFPINRFRSNRMNELNCFACILIIESFNENFIYLMYTHIDNCRLPVDLSHFCTISNEISKQQILKSIICYRFAREVNTPNCIIYPFHFANIRFSFYLNPVVTLWRLQKLNLYICTSLQTNCSWLKISNCKYKYIYQ